MALFRFEDMEDAYNRIVSAEDNDEKRVSYERGSLELPIEFDMFTISRSPPCHLPMNLSSTFSKKAGTGPTIKSSLR